VLINITGSGDLLLHEVSEAASIIQRAAVEDANIIFGAVLDDSMTDEIKITVIATGFDKKEPKSPVDAIQHKPEARGVEPRPEPVSVPLAQVARASSSAVSVQETVSSGSGVFDKNDLDVPAFMRRKLAE
jgi:cell division protein FtsZ